jgi:hypothetical protein
LNYDPPVKPSGTDPFHVFCTRVWEAVWGRGKLIDSPDIIIQQTTRGRSLLIKPRTNPAPPAKPFDCYIVSAIADEWITCRTWNGTECGTNDIKIAKFPESRKSYAQEILPSGVTVTYSAWNWSSQTRIATPNDTGTAETQIIVPRYILSNVSDPTNVTPSVTNKSLVWAAPVTFSGADDGTGKDIGLLEITNRYWCKLA